MRRSSLRRDIIGTALMFLALLILLAVFIGAEHYLENFKSH